MGRYFNPPTESAIASAGGRKLANADHSALIAQLKEGERLGIHLDRFIFRQLADVTDPREFREFNDQTFKGHVTLLGFYAMPSGSFMD